MNRNCDSLTVCVLVLLAVLVTGCGNEPAASEANNQEVAQASGLNSALSTAVRVRVSTVANSAVIRQSQVSGVVEAFRKTTVAAEVGGRVVTRHIEPGDPVEQGQPLFSLDEERASIAQQEARARVRTAQVNLAEARSELRRGENLRARDFISRDTLESLTFAVRRSETQLGVAEANLAAATRALADTVIRAPFSGSAENVHVQQGDYVKAGTPVATLADFSRARVRAGITAREAALLGKSATAELGLDALGSQTVTGTIQSIAHIANPATGTYDVEIWLDNETRSLREGMLATVRLPYEATDESLVVPSAAVFRRSGTLHVFTVEGGKAHLKPVITGRTDGNLIEVTSGLTTGEQVVIEGQFALREGANVTVDGA